MSSWEAISVTSIIANSWYVSARRNHAFEVSVHVARCRLSLFFFLHGIDLMLNKLHISHRSSTCFQPCPRKSSQTLCSFFPPVAFRENASAGGRFFFLRSAAAAVCTFTASGVSYEVACLVFHCTLLWVGSEVAWVEVQQLFLLVDRPTLSFCNANIIRQSEFDGVGKQARGVCSKINPLGCWVTLGLNAVMPTPHSEFLFPFLSRPLSWTSLGCRFRRCISYEGDDIIYRALDVGNTLKCTSR